MNSKIELINSYIKRCDDVINRQAFNAARPLFREIHSVFGKELPNWWDDLQSNYGRAIPGWENRNPFWFDDLPLIKAKLINYAATLETKIAPTRPAINIVNNNTANATAQNTIDFETSIKVAQYKISEMESLSEHDTQEALQKLNELLEIAKSKDSKKSKWSKIGVFFKWIADKSVDLAVAFIPALVQVVSGL